MNTKINTKYEFQYQNSHRSNTNPTTNTNTNTETQEPLNAKVGERTQRTVATRRMGGDGPSKQRDPIRNNFGLDESNNSLEEEIKKDSLKNDTSIGKRWNNGVKMVKKLLSLHASLQAKLKEVESKKQVQEKRVVC